MLQDKLKQEHQPDSSDSEDELLEEYDVILKNNDDKFYVLNNKTNPPNSKIASIEDIKALRVKPQQTSLELDFELDGNSKGLKLESTTFYKHTFASSVQNSRASQYMMKFSEGKLALYPIEKVLSLNPKFESGDADNLVTDEKPTEGEKKKEMLKQAEAKMRNFNFQKDLLGTEEWENYQFVGPEMPIYEKYIRNLTDNSKNSKSTVK
jgi:succinate dehydrogenase flavin-adding protein (antitoxin of CptAB toxin-antitoxin module)